MENKISNKLVNSLLRLPYEMAKEQIAALGEAYGKDYQNHLMQQLKTLTTGVCK